ncbi:MAG: Rrf2 family transcriptional regulator [Lentisphaeraceae bacterium]|nr:Rrf2 family transcriptional regulator [Lentisphaeraceae bacterium]
MFKINKKVEYALMALKHISEKNPDELTSVKEICEKYGSPFDVTSRSMQKMVAGGLLKSEKGAHGGYSLASDLKGANFLDFMEMVVEPVTLVSCAGDDSNCAMSSTCNIISPLVNLNQKMRGFFETISVLEILDMEAESLSKIAAVNG